MKNPNLEMIGVCKYKRPLIFFAGKCPNLTIQSLLGANVSPSSLIIKSPMSPRPISSTPTSTSDDQEQFQNNVDFQALEHLENPDHHVESVRVASLLDKIRSIFDVIECPAQFIVKDLLMPNANRTETFLGTLLNFLLHCETMLEFLRPVVEEMTRDDEHRQQLEAEIAQLNGEIAEVNAQREHELPFVQEIDARVKELRQSVQNLNNHQVSLRVSIAKTKEKIKEMDDKIGNAEFALVQSAQENGSLHAKIVQSPDKLQRALEEKRLLKVEAEKADKAARQSYHDKAAEMEMYTKACKKISKQCNRVKAIQEQVNSSKAIEKEIKLLKAKLNEEGVLDKSVDAKLVEMQTKVEQLEEIKNSCSMKEISNVRRQQKNVAILKWRWIQKGVVLYLGESRWKL